MEWTGGTNMACLESFLALLALLGALFGALALRRVRKLEAVVAQMRSQSSPAAQAFAPVAQAAAPITPIAPFAPVPAAGAPQSDAPIGALLYPPLPPPPPPRYAPAAGPTGPPLVTAFPVTTVGGPAAPERATFAPPVAAAAAPSVAGPSAPTTKAPRFSGFEELLGARLFVWIGSAALALAGAFLVKFSVEHGFISPSIRVTLGVLFGLALLGGSELLRRNTPGIAHALAAAGIADLLACFYAATQLYQLIPPAVGFALMALVAIVGVALALRQGPIVALIGLVGGFLSPLMTGHAPDERTLFIYLLVLAAALMAVAARRGWWWLTAMALAGSLAWVFASFGFQHGRLGGDGNELVTELFLTILAVIIFGTRQWNPEAAPSRINGWVTAIGLALIAPILSMAAAFDGFKPGDWAFCLLLGLALMVLARLDPFFDLLAWVAPAVVAFLLAGWTSAHMNGAVQVGDELLQFNDRYRWTAAIVGLLFTGAAWAGTVSFLRYPGKKPRAGRWGSLTTTCAIAFFVLVHEGPPLPGFHWGITALVLAAVLLVGLLPFMSRLGEPGAEAAAAALAVGVTTLISFTVSLELRDTWMTVAWGLEALAVAAIAGRFRLPALPTLARILVAIVLCRLLLNPAIAAYSFTGLPVWAGLGLLYGTPLLCFLAAAHRLRRHPWHGPTGSGVAEFEWSALFVGLALLTLEIREAFHPGHMFELKMGFAEAGAFSVGWMLAGWALVRSARRWPRPPFVVGGTAVFLLGLCFALTGPLLGANPYINGDPVGSMPILNLVLVVFGSCSALAALGAHEFRQRGWRPLAVVVAIAAQILAFVLLSLEVRQAFHGTDLQTGGVEPSERYTYSAAWILYGLALLVAGLLRKSGGRALRFGSLAIMLLAVGKVFLSDTARLSDLYRVFSFFGLGVSLLVLGFLYQRFVFRRPNE
jgi:uncharacterized membrane protein